MSNNNEAEVIRNRIWDTWSIGLTEDEYLELDRKLDSLYQRNPTSDILFLKTELLIHKINTIKTMATEYAEEGLKIDPCNQDLHDNLNRSMGGIMVDFKKRNKSSLIKRYMDFVEKNPKIIIARRILIENLISTFRLDEAHKLILDSLKYSGKSSFYLKVQLGEIEYLRGNRKGAKKIWHEIEKENNGNSKVYFAIAEQYANFAVYDLAIEYYHKSYSMQKSPRRIDELQSLVDIYFIKNQYDKCIEVLIEILKVYKEDYDIAEGEEVLPYQKKIKEFRKILGACH